MTEEEKKAIEHIDKRLTIEKYTKNIGTAVNIKELQIAFNLIQKQQAEIEKKDKIIDKIADYISSLDIDEDICSKNKGRNCEEGFESENLGEYCKNCIKQYFEKKVDEEYAKNI